MRPGPLLLILGFSLTGTGVAAQQMLVCPAGSSGTSRACTAFHYHVQMYRPDTRGFLDVFGGNQFATESACNRARDAQMTRNLAVVDYFKRVKEQQYEPDRFGPCHCDGTVDEANPNFLTDAARRAQLRTAEEVRLRVREKLLDNNVPSDSPLVRGLYATQPPAQLIATPKMVPPPQTMATSPAVNATDLQSTRAIDASKPAVASVDLPLIDVLSPTPLPAAAGEDSREAAGEGVSPTPATPASNGNGEITVTETPVAEETTEAAPSAEEIASAQEIAEQFVSYETQRIQNVLKAADGITDSDLSARVLEACVQRLQVLSNLRILIEGSGMYSRLANAARVAQSEQERLTFARRLFGSDVTQHWAPKEADDVIFDVPADVSVEPDRVLRDTSGKFSDDQKKRALYVVLARTQPTEEQRLWLTNVINAFLQ